MDKVCENRLRRKALRCGFKLERSRRRDPQAVDYGHYRVLDVRTDRRGSVITPGWDGFGLKPEDVESFLESRIQARQT